MSSKLTTAGALFFLVSTVPLALWRAYVIVRLWTWYVMPFGAPSIGVVTAYGLTLVAGVLGGGIYRSSKEPDSDGEIIDRIVGSAFLTGIALLFGWIAFQFR